MKCTCCSLERRESGEIGTRPHDRMDGIPFVQEPRAEVASHETIRAGHQYAAPHRLERRLE